jgi:3-dehydroquinate synthase
VVFSGFRGALNQQLSKTARVVIISNGTVFALHGQSLLKEILPANLQVESLMIGDGEKYKSKNTVNSLYDHLFDLGIDRSDTIIAFGGGVVGDTAGYVAATYKRGVNLVQVPTTLLSMVDSSVGGKTGINHRLGKNLIGAFYHPGGVLIHPAWLTTLGRREMIEGLAEIIKAGFLSSAAMLRTASGLDPEYSQVNSQDYLRLIRSAITFKAGVVAGDPYDKGRRAILNFGHTFGHAIEKAEGYRRYHHGEAVLAGMVGALHLSQKQGGLSKALLGEYLEYLIPLISHLKPLKKEVGDYISPMAVDKKNKGGKRIFVLLKRIGRPEVRAVGSMASIKESVEFMIDFVNNRGKW